MERPGLTKIMEVLIWLMLGMAAAVVVAGMLGFMEVEMTELVQIFELQNIMDMAGLGGEP